MSARKEMYLSYPKTPNLAYRLEKDEIKKEKKCSRSRDLSLDPRELGACAEREYKKTPAGERLALGSGIMSAYLTLIA